MAEDEFRGPDTSLGVTLDRDRGSVIFDSDSLPQLNFDARHLFGVQSRLVESVHKDLIKDLEESWTDTDRSKDKLVVT